jgi:hypothetical protein
MKLSDFLPFLKKQPDNVWVSASAVQSEVTKSEWERLFIEIEDNLGGPLDILDKNDPPRRRVLGQSPSQLADYIHRITKHDSFFVHGVRHYDNCSLDCHQVVEDDLLFLNFLLTRPYGDDVDDLMDWSDAVLNALGTIFGPFAMEVDLQSRRAKCKKAFQQPNGHQLWIGRQIARLGWKQYFGKSLTHKFSDKWAELPILTEHFLTGTVLSLSTRIDEVDEALVDEVQRKLAGRASIDLLPLAELLETSPNE